MFKPRIAQKEILKYKGGFLGISAVPGSGKTHTLSCLAANLILKDLIKDDQEVLIVTLVNSAVDNFSQRVAAFMKEYHLLPNIGYRVRTLHGLAHDIVREKPQLAGLDNQFSIADERTVQNILQSLVKNWLNQNLAFLNDYTHPSENPSRRYIRDNWNDTLTALASSFIKQAKDYQATPETLQSLLEKTDVNHPLLNFGCDIYYQYRNILHIQSQVDFEDLMQHAYAILKSDAEYLQRLRQRWPFILEDEAQDSSQIQEKILRILAGENGNWVRVGDPNQAIYETFTTADPKYLQNFRREKGVFAIDLPDSGRSTHSIIKLANHLISWCQNLETDIFKKTLSTPFIQPTSTDDPQPNPPDQPEKIFLFSKVLKSEVEIEIVSNSVKEWISTHPQKTLAVLVPRNEKGAQIVQALRDLGIEAVEILQSSQATRQVAHLLNKILLLINSPTDAKFTADVFSLIYQPKNNNGDQLSSLDQFCKAVRSISKVEDLLFREDIVEVLIQNNNVASTSAISDQWRNFSSIFNIWQKASLLPISQFIILISQQLFTQPADLALCYKFSTLLGRMSILHTEWGYKEFAQELALIANSQTKLYGFSDDDLRFDPQKYQGRAVVSTIHKAKGLEWDRVYLLSVNNYDFPFNEDGDEYFAEKWFVRDNLNLEAETLGLLKELLEHKHHASLPEEGVATMHARQEIAAERIRVFYVGITRAKEELIIAWNKGRKNKCHIAVPFAELVDFWEKERHANTE